MVDLLLGRLSLLSTIPGISLLCGVILRLSENMLEFGDVP